MESHYRISSPESLIRTIREFGLLPFFKGRIPGWSIEELTDPDVWFTSSEELGPWDWKIDAVREGDIAYGKFISGKAAFATVEYYAHLMNWRRSVKKYRACLGENFPAKTRSDILIKALSPAALQALRQNGVCNMSEIRAAMGEAVTPTLVKRLGEEYRGKLIPSVKKNIGDFIMQYLEMGTWTVIGDFERIYKGPNCEYSGWQRSSHTTPEDLFDPSDGVYTGDEPSWAARFSSPEENHTVTPLSVSCSPEESLSFLVGHVRNITEYGDDNVIEKILK